MCTNRGSGDIEQKAHRDILAVCAWSGTNNCAKILLNVGLVNKITSEVSEPEPAKIHKELVGYMIEGEVVCC
jgi:hypothetical protein